MFLITEMIDKKYTYAVIGASQNTEKYWYKVLKDLLENNYNAIPINPNEENPILNQKTFPDLKSVPHHIDTVICVVPPKVTEQIVKQAHALWIKNIWMQPWSESEEAINYCQKNNINCISNACIMLKKNEI